MLVLSPAPGTTVCWRASELKVSSPSAGLYPSSLVWPPWWAGTKKSCPKAWTTAAHLASWGACLRRWWTWSTWSTSTFLLAYSSPSCWCWPSTCVSSWQHATSWGWSKWKWFMERSHAPLCKKKFRWPSLWPSLWACSLSAGCLCTSSTASTSSAHNASVLLFGSCTWPSSSPMPTPWLTPLSTPTASGSSKRPSVRLSVATSWASSRCWRAAAVSATLLTTASRAPSGSTQTPSTLNFLQSKATVKTPTAVLLIFHL